MNIHISFIIPLYNCERWIGQCLDSILSIEINEDNYEVIIIDDGSKDRGIQIVKGYQEKHSNIKLIRQENKGASSARNKGLEHAKGEWIWFVDADDAIITECLNRGSAIRKAMETPLSQMIVFNYKIDFGTHSDDEITFTEPRNVEGCTYLMTGKLYLWNRLFRRKLIKDISFIEGTKNIEDFYFDICSIINLEHVVCLPVCGYLYNQQNNQSTSRNLSVNNLKKLSEDTQTIYAYLLSDLKKLNGRKAKVVSELLYFSVAGYLYSLLKFYNKQGLYNGIEYLRKVNLYPAHYTKNRKANIFLFFANNEKVLEIGNSICHFLLNK